MFIVTLLKIVFHATFNTWCLIYGLCQNCERIAKEFFALILFYFVVVFFWRHHVACRILAPRPAIKLVPWHWKCWILTTGLSGKSLRASFLFNIYSQIFCLCSRVKCHRKWFPFERSYLSVVVITKDDRNLIDGWKGPMKFVLWMDLEQHCVPTSRVSVLPTPTCCDLHFQ